MQRLSVSVMKVSTFDRTRRDASRRAVDPEMHIRNAQCISMLSITEA